MAEVYQSDAWIDNHYRDRWEDIYGHDPLDPPEYEPPEYEEDEEDDSE